MVSKPIRTTSKVLRAFMEEMEHCGIPANVYHERAPKEVHNWRTGRHSPNILTVEEMLDFNGYELVLRKKQK